MKEQEYSEEKKKKKPNPKASGSKHKRTNAFVEENNPLFPGDDSFYEEDELGGDHDKEAQMIEDANKQNKEWIMEMFNFLADKDEERVKNGEQDGLSSGGAFCRRQAINISEELGNKVEVPQSLKEYEQQGVVGPNYKRRKSIENKALVKEAMANMEKEQAEKKALKDGYQEYKISTANRVELQKNADSIAMLYKKLDSKDHWYRGSSPAFRQLKENLKTLQKLANEMVVESRQSGKDIWKVRQHTQFLYTQCAQQVLQDAKNYLAYKKNKINSDYAQARFDAVTELKKCITANDQSTFEAFSKEAVRRHEGRKGEVKLKQQTEAKMEQIRAWKSDLLDAYNYDISKTNAENRKTFLGENFTRESLEKIPSNFSIYRMSAVHVTLLAMMNQTKDGKPKYAIEDILDCKKLQKEKQEMFKTVVAKMTRDTGDPKWVAEQIYEGSQIAHRYMGEYASKVDFSKPDAMYSRDFFIAGKLSMIMFDSWQESKNCKQEFLEYAKTKDPTIKDFDQAHKKLGNMRGLMDSCMLYLSNNAETILGKNEEKSTYSGNLLKYAFMTKEFKQMFAERSKTAGNKHISEWFTAEEMQNSRLKEGAAITAFGDYALTKDEIERARPYVLNDSIFAPLKVEYTVDHANIREAKIKGKLPLDIIQENLQYVKMDPQDVYLKLNQQLDHFMELKKTADPDMQVYLDNAIRGMTELGKLSEKARSLTDEEKKVAKAAMKAVFSYHLADNFHDIGATGDTLRESVYQNIDKLEQYQRYVKNIDKGSVASLVISNQNLAVSNADEVILAKGKIAKDMLESGAYKTPKMVKLGFAFAYTQSVQEAAGKLPHDIINHKNPSPYEHAAHVFEHIDEYLKPDMIKQYQKKGEKPDLLTNRDQMKQYARNYKIGQQGALVNQAGRQAGMGTNP